MKKTPERIEHLASEYVLGTLRGRAKQRFERWMVESSLVRREVWYWEDKLGKLSDAVPEEKPPLRVWSNIESRLWPRQLRKTRSLAAWLWPAWSAFASVAALVMVVLLVQQPQPQPTDNRLLSGAVVQPNVKDPLWLVSGHGASDTLSLRPVAASQAETGKDYELWIVPESGNPISLGVIPVGNVYQVSLTPVTRAALINSRTLAISLEPTGGSPTGAPTGPILHITKLYEI